MSLFGDIFGTAVDIYGGIYGEIANEGLNLAEGRTSAKEVLGDTGTELARGQTTNEVAADTNATKSAEGDAAAVTGSTAIQQNKPTQTVVNLAGDAYGVGAGGLGIGNTARSALNTAPATTDAISGAQAVGNTISSNAPDAVSAADGVGSAINPGVETAIDETSKPISAGETLINEETVKPKTSVLSAVGKGLSAAGKTTSSAADTYNKFKTQEKELDDDSFVPAAPEISTQQKATPIPNYGNQFTAIFGTPSVKNVPNLINPKSTNSPLNPINDDNSYAPQPSPALITPPIIPQFRSAAAPGSYDTPFQSADTYQSIGNKPVASDKNLKTNIKSADRSIQNFLKQIAGNK